ncbi:MAG: ABC transporter substrate-binding protein, partial [Microbacteriaceae bacterium]|nr:ABC transporter substrate-binding protein [Microbacteriaceae bacterium]
TAGDAYPIELLGLAGATSVASELDIHRTGPITAEQLVQANPDGIVLIDMNGTGDRMFTELLQNPAVAAIPALAEGRVLRVAGRQVQALGVTETIAGLEAMTDWVATLDRV